MASNKDVNSAGGGGGGLLGLSSLDVRSQQGPSPKKSKPEKPKTKPKNFEILGSASFSPSQTSITSVPTIHQHQIIPERSDLTSSSSPSQREPLSLPLVQDGVRGRLELTTSSVLKENTTAAPIDKSNGAEPTPEQMDNNVVTPGRPGHGFTPARYLEGEATRVLLESPSSSRASKPLTFEAPPLSTEIEMAVENPMIPTMKGDSDSREPESPAPSMPVTAREENGSASVSDPSVQGSVPYPEQGIEIAALKECTSNSPGNIIYKLVCVDQENHRREIIRYSWKPFEGLTRDLNEDVERQKLAVMDTMSLIRGTPSSVGRKSQHRHNFGTSDDEDPTAFIVGVDFYSRTVAETSIRILSPQLLDVIRSLILYYPGFDLQSKELLIQEPYALIFHYQDKLTQISEAFDKEQVPIVMEHQETGFKTTIAYEENTKSHIDVLLTSPAVQKVFTFTIAPERALHQKGLAKFNNLWILFRPGDIVFNRIHGALAGYVVERITYRSPLGSHSPEAHQLPNDKWELNLWNLEYKNRKIVRKSHTFHIDRYHGEKQISELPMFPISFMGDDGALKGELIERGARYYQIICDEKRHMRYDGLTISDKRPYSYHGEIIVDYESYMLESSSKMETMELSGKVPGDSRGEPLFSKFNDMECSRDSPLVPEQYLLLPGYVLGFALGKKEWEVFDMNYVSDIPKPKFPPMNYLKLDEGSTDLILAAVGKPTDSNGLKPWGSDWSADFIEGKGKRKVVFLHGPPGTGKTLTAECVAKYTKRPLISISAADLGTEEIRMETNLVKWLDRATLWGAIVLVDEAEVYLEQRQTGDLTRNALVTAFLRTMEYFPGVLFLTSNGIGLFDEAVQSRIHLSIGYERPDKDQRLKIWGALMQKLKDDQLERQDRETKKAGAVTANSGNTATNPSSPLIVFSDCATRFITLELGNTEYGELPLNGRDIRNILICAISIGQKSYNDRLGKDNASSTVDITRDNIKLALDNKWKFRVDFNKATGYHPEELAARNFLRSQQTNVESDAGMYR